MPFLQRLLGCEAYGAPCSLDTAHAATSALLAEALTAAKATCAQHKPAAHAHLLSLWHSKLQQRYSQWYQQQGLLTVAEERQLKQQLQQQQDPSA